MLTAISTAFHKGGWGMWPILFTSVVTIAIIVERAVYLFRASVDKDKLLALLKSQVMSGNVQGAIKVCSGNPTPMTRIVQAGLMKFNKSDEEVQAAMDEAALRELPKINARTPYLAMTANFAVMAGLLGTISGMIKSFGSVGSDEGGNKATELANEAYKSGKGILEIIREKKILTEQQIQELLNPANLTGLDKAKYTTK